jgi:cytochrome c553
MKKIGLALAAGAGVAAAAVHYLNAPPDQEPAAGITIPALSAAALRGEAAFAKVCAECHGRSGEGAEGKGPPLLHQFYHPGHHGDAAFVMAVRQGARQHHWTYGDMEPVQGVSDADLVAIIAFVREVQRANGIF